MDKEYNNKFKKNIDELLPVLKEGFISFYGEEYQDRISNTIDSTRFVFIDKNNHVCSDIKINDLNANEQTKVNEYLKNIEETLGGLIPNLLPPAIIYKISKPLSLHALVHELNHALHLGIGEPSKISNPAFIIHQFKPSIGFTGEKSDYIYELVNEYMSYDILKNICDRVPENDNIDISFDDRRYVYLDMIAEGKVRDLYRANKESLKDKLINFHGYEVPYEFGYNNYDKYLSTYASIQKEYEKHYIPLIASGKPSDISHDMVVKTLTGAFRNDFKSFKTK